MYLYSRLSSRVFTIWLQPPSRANFGFNGPESAFIRGGSDVREDLVALRLLILVYSLELQRLLLRLLILREDANEPLAV